MNNLILKDIKNIYENYFVLIIIVIFVSIYFVINYNKVMDNNFSAVDFVHPLLITCIIILICNLVIFPNDNDSDLDAESSVHNIYKIINKESKHNNDDFEDIKEQKIYKILNDENNNNNNNAIKINNDKNHSNNNNLNNNNAIKIKNDKNHSNNNNLNNNFNNNNNLNNNVNNNVNNADSDDKYLNKNIFLPFKSKNIKFQLKT